MIKLKNILKNILAENNRQSGTKIINEDTDQNNNGYPDNTENSSQNTNLTITNDPILKKYGFVETKTPDTLKGKLVTSAHLNDVTTIAYFDNSKWNLPADPFKKNKIKNEIHTTLGNTLSKYIGGKLKSIWTSSNADLPSNITAIAMIQGAAPIIKIDNGRVYKNLMHKSVIDNRISKMSRKVIGTYDGKPFELETIHGITLIHVNGELIDDQDLKYQEILDAVIKQGYELQDDRLLLKKHYVMNPN